MRGDRAFLRGNRGGKRRGRRVGSRACGGNVRAIARERRLRKVWRGGERVQRFRNFFKKDADSQKIRRRVFPRLCVVSLRRERRERLFPSGEQFLEEKALPLYGRLQLRIGDEEGKRGVRARGIFHKLVNAAPYRVVDIGVSALKRIHERAACLRFRNLDARKQRESYRAKRRADACAECAKPRLGRGERRLFLDDFRAGVFVLH